jgi:hypothetical protein
MIQNFIDTSLIWVLSFVVIETLHSKAYVYIGCVKSVSGFKGPSQYISWNQFLLRYMRLNV